MKKNRIEKRDRLIILKDRVDELKELELQTLEYDELEREYNMIQNVDRIARAAGNAGIILTGEILKMFLI